MQISQASLTTSKISTLQLDKPTEQKPQVSTLLPYTLKWRQEQLWVSKTFELPEQQYLPGLDSEQQLIDCLKHSPVRLVCIDQNLGEEKIKRWAYACKQAKKKIFLRVPFNFELTSKRRAFSWWLKRVIEWIIATLLLLVLSPIILGVMLLMRVYSSRPIFCQQWRIGERGKLYQVLKFCTAESDTEQLNPLLTSNESKRHKPRYSSYINPLGNWVHKTKLDELPQLINVLRGEMSLIGPIPFTLDEAVGLNGAEQRLLRILPGIIGVRHINVRSNSLNEVIN